jgi:hypothetical protein
MWTLLAAVDPSAIISLGQFGPLGESLASKQETIDAR